MATLTTEQLDKIESGSRGLTTEELDSMESAPQLEIDPEVIAKKRTSEVFGTIFGLDEPTTIATYDTLAKNMYGQNLKPSQVQKMMEEDGFQIGAEDIDESVFKREETPRTAELQRRESNRQIYNMFRSLQLADDIIFDPENQWYKENIATKPKAKEGVLYSEPVHATEDLLDFDTYASLLEKSATQENVEGLRRERKSLLAQKYNEVLEQNADYYDIQEWSEFSTGSKAEDVTLEAAKGLYTALKTVERGVWSTSIAMGMAWNQPNLDRVEEQLKNAKLTPMKAAGKIGYVTRAMSEAIPNFAYNMTIGNAGIFITEYGNAKQDALNDGANELESDAIALPVATINTIIEGWQIDKIFKVAGLGKGAKQAVKQAIKDRSYKAFIKGGAKFTGQSILASINEGIEGFVQEGVSIAVPGFVIGNYPKDENGRIDWAGILTRMGQSFVGEGLGGLFLGTGGAVYNARNVQNYKHDLAVNLIVNEGMESKHALEVATNIVERLRNNEAAPKEIYREEVGKVKKIDNRAKAAAHIIKRGKEMSDEQYRQIAIDATGKESMVDMTYEEGEKFIDALNKAKVEKVEPEEGRVKEEVTEKEIIDEIEEIKTAEEVPETPIPASTPPVEARKEVGAGMIVYHGTESDIKAEEIEPDKRMKGIYTTVSKEAAKTYGKNVLAFNVKPDAKVLDLSDGEVLWSFMEKQGILEENDLTNEDLRNYVINGQIFQYDISSKTNFADDVVKTAKSLGYDIVQIPDVLPESEDNIANVVINKDVLIPAAPEAKTAEKQIWYHGTQSEVAEKIRETGFIPSKEGTAGPGVYIGPSPDEVLYERHPELSESVKKTGKQPDEAIPITIKGSLFDTGIYGRKDGPSPYLKPQVWAAMQLEPEISVKDAMENATQILEKHGYIGVQWQFEDGRKGAVVFKSENIVLAEYPELAKGEKAEVVSEIIMSTKEGDLVVPEIVQTKTNRGQIAAKKDWKYPAIFMRKFVSTVPEFFENPIFVVEKGMMVFRNGGTFRINPEMFGLKEGDLQEDQKIRVDLASYSVKVPSQAKLRREKGFGFRGGFLSNTPFGNKGKLQEKVDEVISLLGKPKKVSTEEKKKSLKELKRTDTLETFVNVAEDAIKGIDRAFGVMSTRIKNISKNLFQEVRNKYVNPVKMIVADRTKKVHPFVDAIEKQLSEQDKYDFEVARFLDDYDAIEQIFEKYGLQQDYDTYRLVFDLIFHEGKAVGMDMNYRDVYFPRKVKDFDGLLKELSKREEYAPVVKALADAQDKKGRDLSKEEQIQILDTLLRGYRSTSISLTPPGFTRIRTLVHEDTSLIKYYYGFAETTSRYIESMTENIQARKFFGKQTKDIVDLRANISRQKTNIAKWEKDTTKDRTENIQKAKDKLQEYETKLLTLDDGTLKASIGNYVLDLINEGTINYDQQVELKQIFDGLFNTVGSNRWVHTLRSLEYVGSLAQVPALVTQYSEVVLSILKAPGTTLPNWVRAHLNKSKIKLQDIGVAHIGQEWADADFNNTMTSLMKAFEKVDKIGKETFINSVIDKYRKMAKNNPDKVKEELSKYYPETEHQAIIDSLISGVVDNNIKGFALNELADVQPISKMEVPELYAKAGNLRVFYMYKTFTLKRLDIMRNQAYNDIKEGIKSGSHRQLLKGLGKLLWLALIFTLADSSADVVKDIIRGKPLQGIPDYVVDNLLQMILLSKYSANKVRTEGVSAFFRDNIALPVSTIDAAAKDIGTLMDEDSEKGSELARRIPWIGDLYYWYLGEGARKVEEGYYD